MCVLIIEKNLGILFLNVTYDVLAMSLISCSTIDTERVVGAYSTKLGPCGGRVTVILVRYACHDLLTRYESEVCLRGE